MRKWNRLFIAGVCAAALLASFAIVSIAQNRELSDAEKFIPSPIFSPVYPTLPHSFRDLKTIQVLCQAPPGAIQRALMPPLEPAGSGDLFVLLLGWTPDINDGGFNVHETAINAPVKYKDRNGCTTLIEYIDSDMGLITGREVWGWPKKMSDTTWMENKRTNTWTVMINKQRDQGNLPLMKVEYTVTNAPSTVQWPEMGPTLLVRRIPPASRTMKSLNQLICVGCSRPEDSGIPLVGAGPASKPQRNTTSTTGVATVQFFDGPNDPLTFLGPVKVLDAKMSAMEGSMPGGLSVGDLLDQWEE